MKKYYEDLLNGWVCFDKESAKEVADIIIKKENVTDVDNFDFEAYYGNYGCRQTEEEILKEYNNNRGCNKPITTKDISNLDYVSVLKDGTFIVWTY